MSDIQLKPCPFCGGDVELEQTLKKTGWGVVCRNRLNLGGTCAIETVPSKFKEAAIARWNTRAPNPLESHNRELLAVIAAKDKELTNIKNDATDPYAITCAEDALDIKPGDIALIEVGNMQENGKVCLYSLDLRVSSLVTTGTKFYSIQTKSNTEYRMI